MKKGFLKMSLGLVDPPNPSSSVLYFVRCFKAVFLNHGNNSIFIAFCGLSGFLLLVSWLVHASFVRMRQIADYY